MTSPADHASSPVSQLIDDPASRAFGVRWVSGGPGDPLVFEQELVSAQLDSRGGIPLRSIGVLIDSTVGSAAYQVTDESESEFVVSHLSVSLAAGAAGARTVTAVAEDCVLDPVTGTGVSTARVEVGESLVARVVCRSVRATRQRVGEADHRGPSTPDTTEVAALGLSPTIIGPGDSLATAWPTQPWMGNGLGSVQGGVILSSAAAVAEQATAQRAQPWDHHRVIDISLEIMRSPLAEDGEIYHWRSAELRRGRRLTVLTSTLHDADGRLYAQSTATVLALRD